MARTLARIAALATALVLALGPAAAQEPARPDLSEARERWRSFTPEQRELLRRRFAELQRMDEGERRALRERAHELDRSLRRAERGLSEDERRALAQLPPFERRHRLHELFAQRLHDRGRRIRERLPPELVERLERAEPRERFGILHRYQRQHREERAEHVLRELVERGRLSRERADELLALPSEERLARLLALKRAAIAESVQRRGLPPGVTAEQWEAWRALDDAAFFERWQRVAPRGPPERPASSPGGPRRGPLRAGPDPRDGRPPPGPPGRRRTH